jgi:hypothetical protein
VIALLRPTELGEISFLKSNHLCKGYDAVSLFMHILSQIANV